MPLVPLDRLLSEGLNLPLRHHGNIVTGEELRSSLMAAAADLRSTVGPAGSEEVALEIEWHYPRR